MRGYTTGRRVVYLLLQVAIDGKPRVTYKLDILTHLIFSFELYPLHEVHAMIGHNGTYQIGQVCIVFTSINHHYHVHFD